MRKENKLRRLIILLNNLVSIPYRLLFTRISVFAGLQNSKVDKKAAICSGVRFYRSEIGKYSYIGKNTFVTDCRIGSFTSISGNCYIGGTSHPTNWVSTSPVFHKWRNILHKNFALHEFEIFKKTVIGNDVWIGEGCKIKAGITIGDGVVIGMGSIVTKDIKPYEVWAGNPAKFIKKRFPDGVDERIRITRWWGWEDERIQDYASFFNNPEKFLEKIKDYEKEKK